MTRERMSAEQYRAHVSELSGGVKRPPYQRINNRIVMTKANYSEADLSHAVMLILAHHGWHFPKRATGNTNAICFRTEQARRSKVTEGLSDWLIEVPGTALFQKVELKTPDGVLSPEQKHLKRRGLILVWRTPQHAWDWCQHTLNEAKQAKGAA